MSSGNYIVFFFMDNVLFYCIKEIFELIRVCIFSFLIYLFVSSIIRRRKIVDGDKYQIYKPDLSVVYIQDSQTSIVYSPTYLPSQII